IHHNRIRMLDKSGSGVGIHLAADDSLIERNDIRLVPASQMPPLETPDQPDPIDPNDPCAKLEAVYFNPRIFMQYVDQVWVLPLPPPPPGGAAYRARGGSQTGAGCERGRATEKVITGGAGNRTPLGDGFTLPGKLPAPPLITIPISEVNVIGTVEDAS